MSEFEKGSGKNQADAPEFLPEVKADFIHWGKMSYWSLEEAIALLLGQNPKFVNWDIVKDYVEWPCTTKLSLDYAKLRVVVLRAFEMQEITDPIAPDIFIAWAKGKDIKIPEKLQEQMAIIKNINNAIQTKKQETLVWEGFDENESTYSKELAIAVKAHNAISKNWKAGSSIKKQISAWLQENHPELLNQEKERIAKICNWQKSGGAPVTP